ncbi:hypothetical protein [Naasia sp. SYSU D00948]|uniref:hypothetical protein n=1 Tax=Naasia sp. SYSU D00948 TaxID=2817379 RepID=UPI001B3161C7|nr:hypothetical protein [Naasia sp. SYSU D00948]
MTITTSGLTRAAAVAAALSGALYILIQLIHPAEAVSSVLEDSWAIVHYLTLAMAVLGLVGVTGIYTVQVTTAGVPGLVGFLLLSGFFLAVAAYNFLEAFVLPPLAERAPEVVEDILGIFGGAPADGSLGPLEQVSVVAFALYLLGGVTFGIAVFRARVLQRWAGILLAAGAASTLVLPLLPHAVGRLAAVPVGLALIWLGWSLWSHERNSRPAAQGASERRLPAGVR